jgi:hypothetical protein
MYRDDRQGAGLAARRRSRDIRLVAACQRSIRWETGAHGPPVSVSLHIRGLVTGDHLGLADDHLCLLDRCDVDQPTFVDGGSFAFGLGLFHGG